MMLRALRYWWSRRGLYRTVAGLERQLATVPSKVEQGLITRAEAIRLLEGLRESGRELPLDTPDDEVVQLAERGYAAVCRALHEVRQMESAR